MCLDKSKQSLYVYICGRFIRLGLTLSMHDLGVNVAHEGRVDILAFCRTYAWHDIPVLSESIAESRKKVDEIRTCALERLQQIRQAERDRQV